MATSWADPFELQYESDDSRSQYQYEVPEFRRPRSRNKAKYDEVFQAPPPPRHPYHHVSYNGAAPAEPVVVKNYHLGVPQTRPRASSQGAAPQPNFIPVIVERDSSQTRMKNYRRKGKDRAGDSSSDESHISTKKLARLKFLEEQEQRRVDAEREKKFKEYMDPVTAERLARLKILEEEAKKPHISPENAEKLARLKAIEERNARAEEQAAWAAKIEEDKRKEKEREERLMLEYREQQRKREEAEQEAVARENQKAAAAAAKRKAEKEQILIEERMRADKEKKEAAEERARILAEEKAKAEKAKKQAEEERKRILAEEEERKKKEKAEWEETRARVLAEEKKKEEEAKAKKKAESDAYRAKVKEDFMAAGFNPDYVEDMLDRKDRKLSHSQASKNSMALQLSRPTYIRVQKRHLLPYTLDVYNLPWEWDPNDSKYILIKEYIDHEFQQELFSHTKMILKQKDAKLITGWTKETVTTLKPNVVKDKDKGETYLVRRKSTGKSPSRPRGGGGGGGNWFLT